MFKKKEKTVKLLVSCQKCGYTSSQATSCPNCKVELKTESAPASLPVVIPNEEQAAKFDDKETDANAGEPPAKNAQSAQSEPIITLGGTDRPVEYAGFARRAFALAIDQVVILAVQWFCLAPLALSIVYNNMLGSIIFWLGLVAMVVVQYWIYTAFFEHSRWQATPGKFLVGLKVTDLKGNPLTFWRSSWRLVIQYLLLFVMYFVFAFTFGLALKAGLHKEIDNELIKASGYVIALLIGYCHVLFSDKKQTLFDKAAHRLVVFQPGYANSQQMTTFECFKRSVGMVPAQIRKFVAIWREKKPGVQFILAASLAVAAYGWSFFAIVEITQNAIMVEQQIAIAKGDEIPKPKVALQHMESVYSTLEGFAEKLGLKDLELALHSRNILFSNNPYLLLGRAQKYIDANKPDLAEKDIRTALKDQSADTDYRFRSTAFSTRAKAEHIQGRDKDAVNSSILALKANPYNLDAHDVLRAVDQSYVSNRSLTKIAENASFNRPPEASFSDIRHSGEMFEIGFRDDKETLAKKITECDRIISLMPDCTQALLTKAMALTKLDRHKESEKYFVQAIASDPTSNHALSEFVASAESTDKADTLRRYRSIAKISDSPAAHSKLATAISETAFDVEDREKRKQVYREALKEINMAIRAYPKARVFLIKRAEIFGSLEQHSDSIRDFKEALKYPIVEQLSELSVSDSSIHQNLAAEYEAVGNFDEALRQLELTLAEEPEDAGAYESKGELLLRLQRYNEALACFDKAIGIKEGLKNVVSEKAMDLILPRIVPKEVMKDTTMTKINSENVAELFAKKGEAYEHLGETDKAIASYERARGTHDRTNEERIAHLYCMKGQPDKAIEAYDRYIAGSQLVKPFHYLRRAALLEEAGRKQDAQTERQKAVALSQKTLEKKKTAENYKDCADVYFTLKDYPKALQYIDSAINIDEDDDSWSLVPKAQILAAQNKFPQALELLREDGKENSEYQLSGHSEVYLACKQYKEAEPLLTSLIKEEPLNAQAYYRRSQVYKQLGQEEKSHQDLEKAKLLGYDKDPLVRMDEF